MRVFATGHRISCGIGFEASNLLGEKLLRLCHGLALDLAEIDLAQAFVHARDKSRRASGRGSRFSGTSQRRAPDRCQLGFGCPSGKSLGLRIAIWVQRNVAAAGIAVLCVPDCRPVPNEEEVCHAAALRWACWATAGATQPRPASSSTSRRYGSRKRPTRSGRGSITSGRAPSRQRPRTPCARPLRPGPPCPRLPRRSPAG